MTTVGMNLASAPRNVAELAVAGPFMLKRLMELSCVHLGVEFDEAQRAAFMRMAVNERAAAVLETLQKIDASQGATLASVPLPPAPPAAAAPTEDKPPRTPTPRAAAPAKTTNGAGAPHPSEEGLAILQGLAHVMKDISASVGAMSTTIKETSTNAARIAALEGKVNESLRLQHLVFSVLFQVAENVLGAPAVDILQQASADYDREGGPCAEVVRLVTGK